MKIAVCISGQPRFYNKGYEYLKKNLLDHYKIDIFFHTWKNETTDFSDLLELYKPTKYTISDPLFNDIDEKYTRIPGEKFPAYFSVSGLYSIYYANLLKMELENNKNFKYDWAVRIRFDYALNVEIDFSILDKTKIYIPNCRMVPERNFGNDQFAVGSSEVMDKYSSTYKHLDQFYNNGTVMIGEDMLRENLTLHNLIGENLVYVDMNNPFPPGPKNSTWHSLIRE